MIRCDASYDAKLTKTTGIDATYAPTAIEQMIRYATKPQKVVRKTLAMVLAVHVRQQIKANASRLDFTNGLSPRNAVSRRPAVSAPPSEDRIQALKLSLQQPLPCTESSMATSIFVIPNSSQCAGMITPI